MRKLVLMLVCLTMLFYMNQASYAGVSSNGQIGTSLVPDTSGGQVPIVQAKWEARPDCYEHGGGWLDDDQTLAGAQFRPSGRKDQNTTIAICAIVSDPDGLSDIGNVYADVFYPESIALGSSHQPLTDQSGLGCGKLMQEDELWRLSKSAGYELFCDRVFAENNNLPSFGQGYDYSAICKADGTLMKETAAVWCGTKELSYEDPSGEYEVWAVGQDKVGQQGILENSFDYLALTAFETDFNAVYYGNVKLNTEKIVSGDLTWDETANSGRASIRNVGNTRAAISIWQDDMGFGITSGAYNVSYRARIGNNEADWMTYRPDEEVWLADELDLSELDEMDFAILVNKFPPTHEGECYTGRMILGATEIKHLGCE